MTPGNVPCRFASPPAELQAGLQFTPGEVKRHFVVVPEGATWAEVSLSCGHVDGSRIFMLHCAHALKGTRADEVERNSRVVMTSHAHRTESLYVVQGSTLEIALAQFWSSAGETQGVTLKVDFHGIVPSPQSVTVDGAGGPRRVDVRAPLKVRRCLSFAWLGVSMSRRVV